MSAASRFPAPHLQRSWPVASADFSIPTSTKNPAGEGLPGGGPWAIEMHKEAGRLEIWVGSRGHSH